MILKKLNKRTPDPALITLGACFGYYFGEESVYAVGGAFLNG